MQPAVAWDKLYARRRAKLYASENQRLGDLENLFFDLSHLGIDADETSILISKFLDSQKSTVDPPAELLYSRLRAFLEGIPADPLHTNSVLLDERCDSTGGVTSTRLWESESGRPDQYGYMDYPPKGDPIFTKVLTTSELKTRLIGTRRQGDAERRIIFVANIIPAIMLTFIETVANRSIPTFRGFCNRHLLFRPVFSIHFSLAKVFNLEFHIPFLALRKACHDSNISKDARLLSREHFRRSRILPLCDETYYYHEAQVSFMVTGVDEWLWTAYCFVDTYFEKEHKWKTYLEKDMDPSTAVLDRRMSQATQEWTALINKFEERMISYEERRREFIDDPSLTHTEKLTSVVSTVRRFRDAVSSTTDAWELFEQSQIQHLQTTGNEVLQERWEGYLTNVRRNVSELKSMRALLARKLEHFNSIRDGFVNAAALRESAASRRQGQNIGILTKMTVIYLPISLATSIFSVSMMPNGGPLVTGLLFMAYFLLVAIVFVLTVYAAKVPELFLDRILPDEGLGNLAEAIESTLGWARRDEDQLPSSSA